MTVSISSDSESVVNKALSTFLEALPKQKLPEEAQAHLVTKGGKLEQIRIRVFMGKKWFILNNYKTLAVIYVYQDIMYDYNLKVVCYDKSVEEACLEAMKEVANQVPEFQKTMFGEHCSLTRKGYY